MDESASGVLFVTIFLGANDACLLPRSTQKSGQGRPTYVSLEDYEQHIRKFVEQVLQHPRAGKTKVILISPPPVSVPCSDDDIPTSESEISRVSSQLKNGIGHQTWRSKRRFAEKIVEIAGDYDENRVAVLDFWKVITTHKCGGNAEEFARLESLNHLPGSGMLGAEEFGDEIFCDGLHLGPEVRL